ncbi:hypothetical protein B0H21DRAFT_736750 [Amylocystis lapponica]|nr:hypothetical protein B0H21DRAFT_736750 [Amylocystis lapponica]
MARLLVPHIGAVILPSGIAFLRITNKSVGGSPRSTSLADSRSGIFPEAERTPTVPRRLVQDARQEVTTTHSRDGPHDEEVNTAIWFNYAEAGKWTIIHRGRVPEQRSW